MSQQNRQDTEVQELRLEVSRTPSDAHITLLQRRLPSSLAILRCLQFMSRAASSPRPSSHILFATTRRDGDIGADSNHVARRQHFAAAYADFFKAPETQMWLYSTLEDHAGGTLPQDEVDLCAGQVFAILRRGRDLSREAVTQGGRSPFGDAFLIGSLHERVRELLLAKGVAFVYHNPHDKWLIHVDGLPASGTLWSPLTISGGDDLRWCGIRREDVPLIISRTKIPKTETTLMSLPSLGVRLVDDTLIAWAFLGVDGSLSTLHCEEPYRGMGIAKALATKIIREHIADFGGDGWCAADVHTENTQSQGVCKSIGGQYGWRNSWSAVDNNSL